MTQKTHLEHVVQYTKLAATTARDIAVSVKVPFLQVAASLTETVLDAVKVGLFDVPKFQSLINSSP